MDYVTVPDEPSANGEPAEAVKTVSTEASTNGQATTPSPQKPRKRKPNYNLIHKKPLPLEAYPLPAFHPTNPISLLRLAYTYLFHLVSPPSSHPAELYIGYFSPESRSVHVTDPKHARALWEMGFFGKGTLSRSEPSWLDREKAQRKADRTGGGTAEEATNKRRAERKMFKLERARIEAERIEKQKLVEEGKLDPSVLENLETDAAIAKRILEEHNSAQTEANMKDLDRAEPIGTNDDLHQDLDSIEDQEHLQLTLEEAFFLSYGLGVLSICYHHPTAGPHEPFTNHNLLTRFSHHSIFPPQSASSIVPPDNQFLLNYVVYHHFRSLGWVVRPGVKFAVDYLLYFRGPVFSHAEFAVIIVPSYTDPYWKTKQGVKERRVKQTNDWWWMHCINRVQSQVLKTLVLCYVEIPAPSAINGTEDDVGALLKTFKVREFVVKRWVANRQRD